MSCKVYSIEGIEIGEVNLYSREPECPLCKCICAKRVEHENQEGIDCICNNCLLEYEYFQLRQFIKIKGFKKERDYEM